MDSYREALRHLLEADRLMTAADETLFRAELATPIDFLVRRLAAPTPAPKPDVVEQAR